MRRKCCALLFSLICLVPLDAAAALITDTATFQAFSITYDPVVWGSLTAGPLTPFTSVFVSGASAEFSFAPSLAATSHGGLVETKGSASILVTAKPGFGIYSTYLEDAGTWSQGQNAAAYPQGSITVTDGQGGALQRTLHGGKMSQVCFYCGPNSGTYYVDGFGAVTDFPVYNMQFTVPSMLATYDYDFIADVRDPTGTAFIGSGVCNANCPFSLPTGIVEYYYPNAVVPEARSLLWLCLGCVWVALSFRRRTSLDTTPPEGHCWAKCHARFLRGFVPK